MVIVSPRTGIFSFSKWPSLHGLVYGGDPITTYDTWEPILQVVFQLSFFGGAFRLHLPLPQVWCLEA